MVTAAYEQVRADGVDAVVALELRSQGVLGLGEGTVARRRLDRRAPRGAPDAPAQRRVGEALGRDELPGRRQLVAEPDVAAPEVLALGVAEGLPALPPLRQPDRSPAEAAGDLRSRLATFDGPVTIALRDPEVTVDGDLAVVHGPTSMTATPVGESEPFTPWFRSAYVPRRAGSAWAIVHQHESVPFHMDGSFRAAVELDPA